MACTPDIVDRWGTNGLTENGTCLYDTNLCGSDWSHTCSSTTPACAADFDYSNSTTAERFRIMGDALLAQNRTILYSICEHGKQEVWTWGNATGSSWRTTNDINELWERITQIINVNSFLSDYTDFWGHNDLDMLEIGNGDLTDAESRTHFALWALMKSPIIIGTDLTQLSDANLAILLNKYLLAFNQDPVYGGPAEPYKWGVNPAWTYNGTNPAEYWSGPSSAGRMVAMFNSLDDARNMTARLGEIPGTRKGHSYAFTDVWTGEVVACVNSSLTVAVDTHDTAVFLLNEGC